MNLPMLPLEKKIALVKVNKQCLVTDFHHEPIVCKYRVLLKCQSTSYELRVVSQYGCELRANEPAS